MYEEEYRTGGEPDDGPYTKTEYRGLPVIEQDIYVPKTATESLAAHAERADSVFAEHVRQLLARTVEILS
jgi:hypothetical protein